DQLFDRRPRAAADSLASNPGGGNVDEGKAREVGPGEWAFGAVGAVWAGLESGRFYGQHDGADIHATHRVREGVVAEHAEDHPRHAGPLGCGEGTGPGKVPRQAASGDR